MNFNKSVHYIAAVFAIFVGFWLIGCGESAPAGGEKMGVSTPAGEGEDLRQVRISTEFGDMVVELSNQTPQHRDNFLELVENGFYDSLLFHRVINEFMIQGGDPASRTASLSTPLGSGGPGYRFPPKSPRICCTTKGHWPRRGKAMPSIRNARARAASFTWFMAGPFRRWSCLTSKPETLVLAWMQESL